MEAKRPLVGVGSVILRGDRVLMVQRGNDPGAGKWALPGGHLEWGERAEDAARREVSEETGVECAIRGFVGHVDGLGPVADGEVSYHFLLLHFWGDWRAGEAVARDDARDAAWLTLDEADRRAGWPETPEIIRRAFRLRAKLNDN